MDDVAISEHPGNTTADGRTLQAGWRVRLFNILLTADTPRRTAAAFSYGVFLSFSPFLGLQIALGLGAAYLLKLSRVAVFAGLCTNLPWIMVPWYTFTTLAGAAALGVEVREDIGPAFTGLLEVPIYQFQFWAQALQILTPFFWSFVIGSTAGALVVGGATYIAVVRAISTARRTPAGER